MVSPLSEVGIFRAIPDGGLAVLDSLGRRRTFSSGAPLMQQGDVSESMHIILQGRVRVEQTRPEIGEPMKLAELGPGEIVGEIGLLDKMPRTATVTAVEPTTTMELDSAALAMTVLRFPDVSVALLRSCSQRLQSADELADQILADRMQEVAPDRGAPSASA